jgi:hypothetical protein
MLELCKLTKDNRYRESAPKAADWSKSQPLCANWNNNSLRVLLLAKIFDVARNLRHPEAAVLKARIGVIPGQLVEGHYYGGWAYPHSGHRA